MSQAYMENLDTDGLNWQDQEHHKCETMLPSTTHEALQLLAESKWKVRMDAPWSRHLWSKTQPNPPSTVQTLAQHAPQKMQL